MPIDARDHVDAVRRATREVAVNRRQPRGGSPRRVV